MGIRIGIGRLIIGQGSGSSAWTPQSFVPPVDGHNIGIIDPSDLTTVTKDSWSYVSEQRDQLGILPALVQATDLAKPHWTASGLYADGLEDILKTAAAAINQPTFIYIVFRPKAWFSLSSLFDGITLNTGRVFDYTASPALRGQAGTMSGDVAGATLEEWHVLSILFNGANGRLTLDNNAPVTGNFGSANMGGLTLFAHGGSGNFLNADIRYILIRDAADSVSLDNSIRTGLKNSYAKDPSNDQFSKGWCVFSFDNGNKSCYDNAFPLFVNRGKKFTNYINGGLIGVNDPLGVLNSTWPELKEMYDAGFDIQCHGKTHAAFSALTSDGLISELLYNDAGFIVAGMNPPAHTGYPEVFKMTQAVLATMRLYRDSGRLFWNTPAEAGGNGTNPFNYIWKGTDRYLMKSFEMDTGANANCVAEAKAIIDHCVAHKCGVFFASHDVNNSGGTYSITIAALTEVLDYAIASGIDILTHSQVAALMSARPAFVPFTNQYLVVLNSTLNIKPTFAIQSAQNTFVKAIVDGGVWNKLDRLFVFAQVDNGSGQCLIDWINPTRTVTLINAPVHSPYAGFTGAASKAINSNFNPSSGVNKFLKDDCSFGCYQRNNRAAADQINIGSSISGVSHHDAALELRYTDGTVMAKLNETAWKPTAVISDARGMFVVSRTESAGFTIYRNKVGTYVTQASQNMPNLNFHILAGINSAGAVAGHDVGAQDAMVFFGGGLTQADVNCLTDAFEVYMDSNGMGVIP